MKTGWVLALGIVCGLLGAGIILLVSRPPRGNAIVLFPPPSPVPLIVFVSGAVAHPDVYTLPFGSRMRDAIQAAGGLSPDADTQTLNLASFLTDGAKVQVSTIPKATNSNVPAQAPVGIVGGLININTASQQELDTLPEIGPALAQRIISYRETKRLFSQIEDIQNVSGIGSVTFEKIKALITVGN